MRHVCEGVLSTRWQPPCSGYHLKTPWESASLAGSSNRWPYAIFEHTLRLWPTLPVELYVNAVAIGWSSDEMKLVSSFSASSMATTIYFSGFFVLVLFFSLGLVFVPPEPYQLLSNACCSMCFSSFESELSPARAFPLRADRLSRVRRRYSTGA
jgi:hypothetical protein